MLKVLTFCPDLLVCSHAFHLMPNGPVVLPWLMGGGLYFSPSTLETSQGWGSFPALVFT